MAGRGNTIPLCARVCVRVCGCASVWCQQKAQNFYARSFDLISAAIFFLVLCSTLATLGGSERREQERGVGGVAGSETDSVRACECV